MAQQQIEEGEMTASRRPVLNGQVVEVRHLPGGTVTALIEFKYLRQCCRDHIEGLEMAVETGTSVDIHHAG